MLDTTVYNQALRLHVENAHKSNMRGDTMQYEKSLRIVVKLISFMADRKYYVAVDPYDQYCRLYFQHRGY